MRMRDVIIIQMSHPDADFGTECKWDASVSG